MSEFKQFRVYPVDKFITKCSWGASWEPRGGTGVGCRLSAGLRGAAQRISAGPAGIRPEWPARRAKEDIIALQGSISCLIAVSWPEVGKIAVQSHVIRSQVSEA